MSQITPAFRLFTLSWERGGALTQCGPLLLLLPSCKHLAILKMLAEIWGRNHLCHPALQLGHP